MTYKIIIDLDILVRSCVGVVEALVPLWWDHNIVLCELRNSTNKLINHQDINYTQKYKDLRGKPFLLEGKKPQDKFRINPLL